MIYLKALKKVLADEGKAMRIEFRAVCFIGALSGFALLLIGLKQGMYDVAKGGLALALIECFGAIMSDESLYKEDNSYEEE